MMIMMNYPAVFGFYGLSNTGKTTLLTKLIQHFTNDGLSVAAVKITDKELTMDVEGKDTWKYRQAGASVTVLSSCNETDYLVYDRHDTSTIMQAICSVGMFDVVFVEGADDLQIPKIQLGNCKKRDHTLFIYHGNFDELVCFLTKEIKQQKSSLKTIAIKVNGKDIPLTEFPAGFITKTITGMLTSLKGVEEIHTVDIRFTTESSVV